MSSLKRPNSKKLKGIALLEVMVAIAIFGVAATALLTRMQSINNTSIFIEERTVAHWIAEDILRSKLADHALQKNIQSVRIEKDTLEYDEREWFWSAELEDVVLPDILAPAKMYRLNIAVGLEQDKPLAMLSGFVGE